METLITWFSGNTWVAYVALPIGLLGALWSARQLRSLADAEWIVSDGQFQIATNDFIEEARQDAYAKGFGEQFDTLLDEVRHHHGRLIKIGHIFWIWARIEGKADPHKPPPSFSRVRAE